MAPKATTTEAPKAKAEPRPSAVVEIDVNSALAEDDMVAPSRKTQWDDKLSQVYDMTAAEEIPTNEDGSLKFVKIGAYKNPQGVQAQIKAFTKRGLDTTYEFRRNANDLYVRVRVGADTADEAIATDEG